MKKLIAIILSLVLILSLCACGSSTSSNSSGSSNSKSNTTKDVKATVVNNKGETEYLTAKDLIDIQESNPLNFDNNYWSAKVTVTGTVNEIGGLSSINGTHYEWTLKVEGGECDWFIGDGKYNTSTVSEDLLASLKKGDTVQISGEIVGASFGQVDISNGTISVTKK